jgi:transposase
MPQTKPPYPREFRTRAVDLVQKTGKTVEEVANDLGVSGQTLRNWIRQAEADAGKGRPGDLTTQEKAELHELKRENRILREERDILKKAAAFFAKESTIR